VEGDRGRWPSWLDMAALQQFGCDVQSFCPMILSCCTLILSFCPL
jgi:hypothetical protein